MFRKNMLSVESWARKSSMPSGALIDIHIMLSFLIRISVENFNVCPSFSKLIFPLSDSHSGNLLLSSIVAINNFAVVGLKVSFLFISFLMLQEAKRKQMNTSKNCLFI